MTLTAKFYSTQFPEMQDVEDDSMSIASDPSSMVSQSTALNRPLISVWIPTAFMVSRITIYTFDYLSINISFL